MRAKNISSLVGANLAGRLSPGGLAGTFLIGALLIGALLVGCGGGDEEASGASPPEKADSAPTSAAPEAPTEERGNVTVRVSGTPGMIFAGTYGNTDKTQKADGILEGEPFEYEVEIRDSGFDTVTATFVKALPDTGNLKVEILVDGEVVTTEESTSQYGALSVTWSFGG